MTSPRFEADHPGSAPAFRRDVTTLACYFLLALLTLFLAVIGPLMPALMRELGLGFAQASLHSVASAAGMAVSGAVGERLARRIGRNGCVQLSIGLMGAGMLLLCAAVHAAMSLTGTFLMGCGGSLTLMVGNSALAERHGAQAGVAFGEANIIAYLGIGAAPGVVSLVTMLANWRWTALVSIGAAVLFLFVFRAADYGRPQGEKRHGVGAPLGFAYWCFWGLLALSVSAESILLIWTPAYFEVQLGWPRESALFAAMAFPAGMLAARLAGVALVRRVPVRRLALPVIALAVAGFLLFRFGGGGWLALAGLSVAGLGLGNLYPFGITLAMAAAGGDRDTATARVSLASAASMITAPLIVGAIADRADLATAFGVIPVYLALAAAVTTAGLARGK